MVPVLAGIVLAGFALGAGVSVFEHRNAGGVADGLPSAQPAPIVTPVPGARRTTEPIEASPPPTLAPAPTATPVRHAKPTPRASPKPEPTASAGVPTPGPAASATGPAPGETAPAAGATAAAERSSAPASPAARVPAPAASARPAAPRPTARPAPPSPSPATPKPAVQRTPAGDVADSEFARRSAATVRAYLAALARGDDAAAQSEIDAPAGSRAARLAEKEFAGPDMRITNVQAHGTGESARVDVDIQTSHGTYFAQFFLEKAASGAPLIVNHDFIKP